MKKSAERRGARALLNMAGCSVFLMVACGTAQEPPDDKQANSSSGGSASMSGGSMSASGGLQVVAPTGGSTASGGDGPSGGAPAALATGGETGTGAAASGGAPAAGGETGTGAAASGGASDGSTGGAGATARSTGCGTDATLTSGEKTIDIAGVTREYVLKIPEDYEPDTAYKLIFGWHWLSGEADDVVGGQITGGPYYGLEERAGGSAIFVAPNGIDNGWANTDGRDIAFLHGMLDLFKADLCIDESKLFSTGFSYGGMMSNSIGCELSDVFRAIAPMSGALYSGCKRDTEHPIAVWMAHGTDDDVVPLSDGQKALDVFLEKNGCGTETTSITPDPCVAYSDCEEGYPVHYCEFDGGHAPPSSWAPQAVWDFFSQF